MPRQDRNPNPPFTLTLETFDFDAAVGACLQTHDFRIACRVRDGGRDRDASNRQLLDQLRDRFFAECDQEFARIYGLLERRRDPAVVPPPMRAEEDLIPYPQTLTIDQRRRPSAEIRWHNAAFEEGWLQRPVPPPEPTLRELFARNQEGQEQCAEQPPNASAEQPAPSASRRSPSTDATNGARSASTRSLLAALI